MRTLAILTVSGLLLFAAGCTAGAKSARGFSLPDGDAERGKRAFVQLQCTACHTVRGVELPPVEGEAEMSIALGGSVDRVKTYGDLVTSVINPSHRLAQTYAVEPYSKDGKSAMRNYNDALTVRQLIDLVAFLQPQYELTPHDSTEYAPYF